MEKTVKKTIETTERYEFTTDDIENLIRDKYDFDDTVDFNWYIGSWVSLTVTVKKSEKA